MTDVEQLLYDELKGIKASIGDLDKRVTDRLVGDLRHPLPALVARGDGQVQFSLRGRFAVYQLPLARHPQAWLTTST